MIHVENTILPVKGLSKEITLLHITDMHLTEADSRDEAQVIELGENRQKVFERPDKVPVKDVYSRFLEYADEIHSDCLVLTGDIIDFPSHPHLELLDATLNKAGRKYLYTLGNHDWSYPFSEESDQNRTLCYPKFHPFTDGTPAFQVKEIAGVKLIAMDNTLYQVSEEQLALLKKQLASPLPCLLFFHIPIFVNSLLEDVVNVWKHPIMAGTPESYLDPGDGWESLVVPTDTTREFCRLLQEDQGERVKGIFSGHVHFSHQDMYREGIYQYITGAGYTGCCRKITLLPV